MNINQVVAYALYLIIMAVVGFILKEVQILKNDKKSFYNQFLSVKDTELQHTKELLGQQNYDKAKQIIVDAVYQAEQLGKEMVWDGLTKHSKVSEWVAGKTNLSEEDIFSIIKSTVGYINSHK
jgi:hypothetical protein